METKLAMHLRTRKHLAATTGSAYQVADGELTLVLPANSPLAISGPALIQRKRYGSINRIGQATRLGA
jgi:hypothetical protein